MNKLNGETFTIPWCSRRFNNTPATNNSTTSTAPTTKFTRVLVTTKKTNSSPVSMGLAINFLLRELWLKSYSNILRLNAKFLIEQMLSAGVTYKATFIYETSYKNAYPWAVQLAIILLNSCLNYFFFCVGRRVIVARSVSGAFFGLARGGKEIHSQDETAFSLQLWSGYGIYCVNISTRAKLGLNRELGLKSLFGLHVESCTQSLCQ
jgi:hypothetical protein